MGREKEESDLKTKLVREICSISKRATSCSRKHSGILTLAPFIDWYLVLQVEENAGFDLIRKQYRKLALQLHPDKNKHPKAENAFKIVSDAYACLSDKARRSEFNLERGKINCTNCKRNQNEICNYSGYKTAKIKDLKARFAQEVRVIENCLKNISESKKENSFKKDYPIFNPAGYLFQGYPHQKKRIYEDFKNFPSLRKNNSLYYGYRKYDSPIFEVR